MRRLAAIVVAIETVLRAIAALCLAVMAALVVLQVILRYGFGAGSIFTEEIARYAMIWMALFASAVAAREGSHIRIDLVPSILSQLAPRCSKLLACLIDVLSLTIFLVLLWWGVDMVVFAVAQTSEGLRLPLAYPYAAVPVAFAFASIFALARLALQDMRA